MKEIIENITMISRHFNSMRFAESIDEFVSGVLENDNFKRALILSVVGACQDRKTVIGLATDDDFVELEKIIQKIITQLCLTSLCLKGFAAIKPTGGDLSATITSMGAKHHETLPR